MIGDKDDNAEGGQGEGPSKRTLGSFERPIYQREPRPSWKPWKSNSDNWIATTTSISPDAEEK